MSERFARRESLKEKPAPVGHITLLCFFRNFGEETLVRTVAMLSCLERAIEPKRDNTQWHAH